ncbi:Zdhhc8 [Ecytonucleospora hepatopenaei]|uniref:Palmitoyltransferase n=1 Tax=Ecytonucleospora hepatopenaei TaxID=646526 RepID=A0A1W0E2U7_9MICR|nr:Zdhhc8 [Ecytonucleospora hepatopenaei]
MFYQSYCSICNHFKPTGTSHCYLCGYCIMDKDHHCMMLNTCIGRNNTKCYFYYILSELVENILLLVLFNIHAHRCIFSDKLKKYKNIINNTKYNNIINNTKYNNTYNTNKYNYKYYIFLLFIKYTCIVFSKLFIIIVLYNLYICVKFYYFALMDVKARDYYIKKKRGRFSIRSVVKRILTFRSAV